VKRSTAVRHLAEIAAEATAQLSFRGTSIGWPLEELWVAGDFLSGSEVDDGVILLRLVMPRAELPWLALHQKGEWVGEHLRLGKRPFSWWYRSIEDPPWNVEHRRVVRVWSASGGVDADVLESLKTESGATMTVVEPDDVEVGAHLERDLVIAKDHLREVVTSYWDRGWRQEHRPQPDDHLWRAASAVCTIEGALKTLQH